MFEMDSDRLTDRQIDQISVFGMQTDRQTDNVYLIFASAYDSDVYFLEGGPVCIRCTCRQFANNGLLCSDVGEIL